jgi:hypothetical protein
VVAGRKTESQHALEEAEGKKGEVSLLSEQGVEERVHVVRRAGIVTVLAGVGYLL